MKKYDFTGSTLEWYSRILNRIRALKDFGDVKAGDLGGWIEKEENLSHEGGCWVYDEAKVYNNVKIYNNVRIGGSAKIEGSAKIGGNATIKGGAVIKSTSDYITISPIGSRDDTTTAFRTADGVIRVKCGCFYGSIDEFKRKVWETHGDNQYGKEYLAVIELLKVRFGENKKSPKSKRRKPLKGDKKY